MPLIITCEDCNRELFDLPDEDEPTTVAKERRKEHRCATCASAHAARQPRLFCEAQQPRLFEVTPAA